MNFVSQHSLTLSPGGTGEKIAISTVSAPSAAYFTPYLVVYSDVACYARSGATPTALATGVDQYLVGGAQYRFPWKDGDKAAFITLTGTGTVYITPGV